MEVDKKLSEVEEAELRDGQYIYEMTKSPGFKILQEKLEDVAFHSWVDPREIEGDNPEKVFMWRELNAFHAANNAKELLEWIAKTISQAQYLEKKKSGEVPGVKRMTI